MIGVHPLDYRSPDRATSTTMSIGDMLFPTTIAGSLPKPAWLAAPQKLWAPWRLEGEELTAAKDDATLLALKIQEDAGIDIVTDGELQGDVPDRDRPAALARARACPRSTARARPHRKET
jgi:hypothetical protein